jgi:hypothetical protein
MAMITVLHALDFAVMRPLPLHRAGAAQFQSQGLEALLNTPGQFLVIFDCSIAEAHLPFHFFNKYHFLRLKARGPIILVPKPSLGRRKKYYSFASHAYWSSLVMVIRCRGSTSVPDTRHDDGHPFQLPLCS